MDRFSGIVNHYHGAKDRITKFFRSGPELMRVHFNLGTASRTINCHGWVLKSYWSDGCLRAGLLKVFAMAGIKAGWKDGARVARDEVDLLEFALVCIAETTAKSQRGSTNRKRRAKA